MTTSDQLHGRFAARTRHPIKGLIFTSALLLSAIATPALAKDAAATTGATASPIVAASGSAGGLVSPLPNAMPLPGQTLLAAGDISQLMAALPAPQENLTEDTPVSGRIQDVLKRALSLLGTPYRWGGTTTAGFDCSGLVSYVFRTALGIELPRVSRDQARAGQRVERSALTAGDLVFFSRSGRNIDHVGIYLGEGQFVHSPRTGRDVMVSRMDTGYWSGRFMQATRVTES